MKQGLATLALIFVLIVATATPARTETAAALTLSSPTRPAWTDTSGQALFPLDTVKVIATVTLTGTDKKKVEFVWHDPTGRVYSHVAKLGFPARGGDIVTISDGIEVAGRPPSEIPGWWDVDAVTPDGKLSKKFLLTKNRHILTVMSGIAEEIIADIPSLDLASPEDAVALNIFFSSPDDTVRMSALEYLSGLGGEWSVRAYERGMSDASVSVRVYCVGLLVPLGGKVSADTAEKAASDASPDVRNALCEALGRYAVSGRVSILGRLIKDTDATVRASALGAVLKAADEDMSSAAIEGMKVGDAAFRKSIVQSLSGPRPAWRSSVYLLGLKDADAEVRYASLDALATDGTPGVEEQVRPFVDDPDEKVSLLAVKYLGALGDVSSVDRAASSAHDTVRSFALGWLRGRKGVGGASGLMSFLKDKDPAVRRSAVEGLELAGDAGAPGLVAALKDEDKGIRLEAVSGLSKLGGAAVDAGMEGALGDTEPLIRIQALSYLISRGVPGLVGILGRSAGDASAEVRTIGLGALVGMPGPDAVSALMAYYSKGDSPTRRTVIDVLTGSPERSSVDVLTAGLGDTDADIRFACVKALIKRGVHAPLYALAGDPDVKVRRAVLGMMRDAPAPDMLPALLGALDDTDEVVRLSSVKALGGIAGDAAGAGLSRALDDASEEVRGAAKVFILDRRDAGSLTGLSKLLSSSDARTRAVALGAIDGIPGVKSDDAISGAYASAHADTRADALKRLARRGSPMLANIVRQGIADPDKDVRKAALGAMDAVGDADKKDICAAAVSSTYEEVRLAGIEKLKGFGGEATLPALSSPDDIVRMSALEYLSGLGGEWSVRAYERGMSDASVSVRVYCVGLLVPLGGKVSADTAEKAASDASPDVRNALCEALGRYAVSGRVSILGRLIKDTDATVRASALGAVLKAADEDMSSAAIEGMKVGDAAFRKSIVQSLSGPRPAWRSSVYLLGLKDADAEVRYASLDALATDGTPGVEEQVRPFVDDPDEKVSLLAVKYLGALGDVSSVDRAASSAHDTVRSFALGWLRGRKGVGGASGLMSFLKDKDPAVRRSAVEGLELAGDAGAPGLVAALKDEDKGIRLEAVSGLSKLGGAAVDAGMEGALGDTEPLIRIQALSYLISRGVPGLVGILGRSAGDASAEVRTIGLGALVGMPGPDAVSALMAYYSKGDSPTRRTVIDVLTGSPERSSVDVLTAGLGDTDADIRFACVKALIKRGVHAPLYALAGDPDVKVRRAVLGMMRDAPAPDMLPALLGALDDTDEVVRLSSVKALGGIAGDAAGAGLSRALDDASEEVRGAAKVFILDRRDAGSLTGLSKLLSSSDARTRAVALGAIDGIPGVKSDDAISGAYASAHADTRADALKRLARRGSPMLANIVRQGIADPDKDVRKAALGAMDAVGDADKKDICAAAVSSTYEEVRLAGIEKLKGFGGEASASVYEGALDDPDVKVRREALSALAGLGRPDLPGYLMRSASDKDRDTREVVLSAALGLEGLPVKAGILLALADWADLDITHKAADALLPICDARALPVYERLFAERYHREEILKGIACVKDDKAAGSLLSAYHAAYDDDTLRLAAVEYMSARGTASLPGLTEAVDDPSKKVRMGAIKASVALGGDAGAEVLGRVLANPDPDTRRAALGGLAGMGGIALVRAMLPSLNDSVLREDALEYLAKRTEPDALTLASEYAPKVDDADFRARIVYALAEAGLQAPQLASFLGDPSPEVRYAASKGLSKRKGVDAAYGFLLMTDAGSDERLKKIAADGIKGLDRDDVIGGLRMLFDKGRATPAILGFAVENLHDAEALRFIVERTGTAAQRNMQGGVLSQLMDRHADYDVPALMEAMKAGSNVDKGGLIFAISRSSGMQAGAALEEIYATYPDMRLAVIAAAVENCRAKVILPAALSDPDPVVRREAASHISEAGAEAAPGLLSTAIKDKDDIVREKAAAAAVKGGYAEAAIQAASDSSASIRLIAAQGLGSVDGDKAAEALKALSLDTDRPVADAALVSLKTMGDKAPSSVWVYIADKAGNDKTIRLEALGVLSARKEPALAGFFAGYVRDPDAGTAAAAFEGVKEFGRGALDELYGMLNDDKLRPKALEAIKDIADPSSEPAILEAMADLGDKDLIHAVDALGAVGGPASLPALSNIYKKGGAETRASVVKALGRMRLGGDEPLLVEVLSDALDSPDDSLRFYAAHAAGERKVAALKGALESRMTVERSPIMKEELRRAIERVSEGRGL